MAQRLTKRWLWRDIIVALWIIIILTGLFLFIFPILGTYPLPELLQDFLTNPSSSFIVGIVLTVFIKWLFNLDFSNRYA